MFFGNNNAMRIKKLLESIKRPNFDGTFNTDQLEGLTSLELQQFLTGAYFHINKKFDDPRIPNEPHSPHMLLKRTLVGFLRTGEKGELVL